MVKLEFDKERDYVSKKIKVIIGVLWLILVAAISLFADFPQKGTVTEFVDDGVVIKSDDGKRVTLIEEYLTYIPTGEQLSIGDRVIIKDGLFDDLSIHRVDK